MSAFGVTVYPVLCEHGRSVLTNDALAFLGYLHRNFNETRLQLLEKRNTIQQQIIKNRGLNFLEETASIRNSEWKVAETPHDLQRRHVEITGPVYPAKMAINAMNSGANCWMADFEDALSPHWTSIIEGHYNMNLITSKTLKFVSPEGKSYDLNPNSKTIPLVRPRGWHLYENHVWVDGQPMSASLFDFGVYFFHNAHQLIKNKSGPYFYLPKMESHLEARLWNSVFVGAQNYMKIPRGTIRATVLIETLLGAFEMDEILYELREHSAGLNAGRWDYIFSAIKKFSHCPDSVLPDRSLVTMRVPFMDNYAKLLVKTCHRRGAHAIGGMAAFIPTNDPKINEVAMGKVRDDKMNELNIGYDATWVAHPGLIPMVAELFEKTLEGKDNQKHVQLDSLTVTASQLLNFNISNGNITEEGVRTNIRAAVLYISSWFAGNGAVAISNLMEDAATAEISRAQLWQWIHHKSKMSNGQVVTRELYMKIRDSENFQDQRAVQLVDNLVLRDDFVDFLTIPAYQMIF